MSAVASPDCARRSFFLRHCRMTAPDSVLCCAPLAAPGLSDEEAEATAALFRALGDRAIAWADVVVATCDEACPIVPGKRYVAWRLRDPKGRSLDEVRL